VGGHGIETAAMDARTRIEACIRHLEHVLPSQASIRDFVHHNTLHGFQHLPFPEALAAASRLTGARAWLPEEASRGFFRAGRIDDSDLAAALERIARDAAIDLDAVLASAGGRTIRRREVLRVGLLYPLAPLPLAEFRWRVEELQALARCHDDVPAEACAALCAGAAESDAVAALWAACLDVLGIDHAFVHPEELLELSAREEQGRPSGPAAPRALAEAAAQLWSELEQKVGAEWTAGELLKRLTDEDALEAVRPALLRHLGGHLDQGLAPWTNPSRRRGFYAAWRLSAVHDLAWPLDNLGSARQEIARLPEDALDAVCAELERLGLPEARWAGYLERLALELPGWSGMFLWRQNHPGYADTREVPVAMLDYLAVRLVLERLVAADIVRRHWSVDWSLPALGEHFRSRPAELWVRHAYHAGQEDALPEYLLDLIEPHLPAEGDAALPLEAGLWEWLAERIEAWRATPTAERTASHGPARSAWPLFRLAMHMGIDAVTLRSLGRSGAEALLGALRQLDEHQRGFIWLNAYERHYREQILAGLAANQGRWKGHATIAGKGPVAQLVFCMDDREEGIRRHLEETDTELETLGGAAHYAVFQNYYGLDDAKPTPLCPVIPEVIVPAHDVHEVPRQGAAGTAGKHRHRHARRLRWQERLHQHSRRSLLLGPLLTVLAAPYALAALLWRSLAPGCFGRFHARLRRRYEIEVPTRLDHTAPADAGPATPQAPRHGFTDAEQAERIGNYLASLGLTRDFAPLVAIMGHGSNSQNNPHMAAYDCGACSGRHSGPNARLFCAMANRPEVRALLAARDIHVPAATWFVAAEHNTADDLITWYDSEDIPDPLRPTFERMDRSLAAAGRAHAQERCRRLYSAPLGIGKAAALRHVIGRRNDYGQPRPELGHVTNACAFVGRRAMSRGAFFDRRAFLISYDPLQDPEGKVLERHLLINGAVGAGISLEYFFSTVNNEQFGCGSKVMHNVAGYFGVMQGASSDLRTGLPKQMIEIHEAMRLLVVVEQTLEIISAVYQRQPPLQELIGNGWVTVAAKDPESGAIHLFDPQQGWQPWDNKAAAAKVPTVGQSADWFAGSREPLPPALLERPLRVAAS
jgi:uncharacterized protein YbcC (UPF0753/DUF2309 family)